MQLKMRKFGSYDVLFYGIGTEAKRLSVAFFRFCAIVLHTIEVADDTEKIWFVIGGRQLLESGEM